MKTTRGELRLISYNIAGLPVKSLLEGRSTLRDAAEIGRQVRAAGYDLLAVQEDFSCYHRLRRALQAPYHSFNKGNVPTGDGLDIFSKRPVCNVTRVPWNELYGGLTFGMADEYTPKGFLHAVMQMAPGVFVDVYNLHAVAGGGSGRQRPWGEPTSVDECRRTEFEQLSAYMQAHSAGRAVIVLGDFNTVLWKACDGLAGALIGPCGLKNTWAGDTEEKIDKILYRSGRGVELSAVEAGSLHWRNAKGRSLSDHASWTATLRYTTTGVKEDGLCLREPEAMPARDKLRGYASGFHHDAGLLRKELRSLPGKKK